MWIESLAPSQHHFDNATPIHPKACVLTSACDPRRRDETRAESFPDIAEDSRTAVAPADDTDSLCCCRSSSDRIQSRTHPTCDSKPGSNRHAFPCPTRALVHNDVRPKKDDEDQAASCNLRPPHATRASV